MKFSEKTVEKFNFINLPKNHWNASLGKLQKTSNSNAVNLWLDSPREAILGKGLYIGGAYGVGKSSMAAIIAKVCLGHGIFSYWLNYRDLPNLVLRDQPFSETEGILARCQTTDLLIIDEIHIQKQQKEFPVQCLDNLIRTRVQGSKPTIVTSNQSFKTLKGLTGLTESLIEISKEAFTPILLTGENKRDDIK